MCSECCVSNSENIDPILGLHAHIGLFVQIPLVVSEAFVNLFSISIIQLYELDILGFIANKP